MCLRSRRELLGSVSSNYQVAYRKEKLHIRGMGCSGTANARATHIGVAIMDAIARVRIREYLTGLLLPGKRKSIEPLAAQIDPGRVCAKHQSLHHFIAAAAWSDRALLRAICHYALPALLHLGEIECWLLDDTGFPKCGKHSVGVARQYCGQLGKALAQIDGALRADLLCALVNADAGFGNNGDFRDALTARRLRYAVGIREKSGC